jgi:hypothetical protein
VRWYPPGLLTFVPLVSLAVLGAAPDPEALIRAVRLDRPSSIRPLDNLRGTAGGVTAAHRLIREGSTGDALWAAVYVYAGGGDDPAPLRGVLNDTNVGIRLLAAEGLALRGDVTGLAALIELLDDATVVPASSPPRGVWWVASLALARSVSAPHLGPAADADQRSRAAARTRWQEWFDANRSRLQFQATTQEWSVR